MLSTAAWTVGKAQVAATVASGTGCRRRVAAVMRPSVPSGPQEPGEVVANCALPGPGDTRQMSAQATHAARSLARGRKE